MSLSEDYRTSALQRTLKALEQDLIDDDGPRISTMRNYRFAIAVYPPREEWDLRRGLSELSDRLKQEGWIVHTISLHRILVDRIKEELGERNIQRIIDREKGLIERGSPDRALNYLEGKIARLVEGPDGLAADVADEIEELVAKNPDDAERIVVFIGRTGAMYPFMRTSALLKHLDGRTKHVRVVLLYPGEKKGENGLSFMGELPPDRDYRPRIYTSDSLKI